MIKRYKCIVQYEGYNYVGWQTQSNGLAIQEVIEKALKDIVKVDVHIISSGRTDAKVHAMNQVFHFDSDCNLSLFDWKKALNGHLPEDIHIKSIEIVQHNFHSRFHAINKRYDYYINIGEYDAFKRRLMYQCPYDLDIDYMKKCSTLFLGTHDFGTFCGNSYETHPNQVRKVDSVIFSIENDILIISYQGKGFLRYMVRMMTGALIEVARHRMTYEDISKMLSTPDKDACKWNAKPWGLYLVKVDYTSEI
jgi:tRNA pseudouridine38-40 synthase